MQRKGAPGESPESLARYPFPFVLQVRHQLLANGFSTTFAVENPGPAPLPFCIGAHTRPSFRLPTMGKRMGFRPDQKAGSPCQMYSVPALSRALPGPWTSTSPC